VAKTDTVCKLMANESFRGIKTRERLFSLFVVTIYTDENPGHLGTRSEHHFGDRSQTNPWIAQLAFENEIDLLSQGLHPPLALVFRGAWLHHEKLPK